MRRIILVGSAAVLLFLGAGCNRYGTGNDIAMVSDKTQEAQDAAARNNEQGQKQSIPPAQNITTTDLEISTQPTPATTLTLDQKLNFNKPTMEIDKNKMYTAVLHTTKGDITIELNAKATPITVNNFVTLSRATFYNGTPFHRTIPGFMIQGGDPQGNGTGGPGYKIRSEFNSRKHEAGVLSMARTNDPHSAGSQIFLCLGRVSHLDNQYTAFGKTADESSLKTVLAIGGVQTGSGDRPVKEVKITSSEVIEKPKKS